MSIFAVVIPIFGIIALGFIVAQIGLLTKSVADGVTAFVVTLALPILLFMTVKEVSFNPDGALLYWLSYFSGVFIVWFLLYLLARKIFATSPNGAVISGFCGGQGNVVMVGLPLILAIYGDAAAIPIVLLLAINLPVNMITATFLLETKNKDADFQHKLLNIFKKLVTHPILIGIVSGFLVNISGLELPLIVENILQPIAESAATVALVALGLTLYQYELRGRLRLIAVVCIGKLVLHPALVLAIGYGVGLEPLWIMVAMIFASAPPGINAFILASRYGVAVDVASGTIALGTLLSAATIPLWLALFL